MLSNFAFNFNLRRYITASVQATDLPTRVYGPGGGRNRSAHELNAIGEMTPHALSALSDRHLVVEPNICCTHVVGHR
jgi:hypothetical protein